MESHKFQSVANVSSDPWSPLFSECRPHPAQNRAPTTFAYWHRGQLTVGPDCGATAGGGTFTIALTGCPHAGTGIPNDAAMADACMALYSRTRPGMKKHSKKPINPGMPDQKKQA